jgi:4-aminobutyrate aminotransferase-like enzyme
MTWQNRADMAIAQGSLTNSKRPSTYIEGVYPTHAKGGKGAHIYAGGKKYLDFVCGLGSNLLGYGNPAIAKAVEAQFLKGATLSLSSEMEVELAEKLKGLFLFCDLWKFGKNGTDVCNAAIRIARAYHGVRYENEEMYNLLGNEALGAFSQGRIEDGWFSEQMQGVCEGVSELAARKRNQTEGSANVLENGKGQGSGDASLCPAMDSLESLGAKTGSLAGTRRPSKGQFDQKTMRSLWDRGASAGPSHGLQQASRRPVAVPPPSLSGSPRVLILSDGYHGTGDYFVGMNPPHMGIVRDPYTLPLTGNWDLIPMAAAVIVEPVVLDWSESRKNYLIELQTTCRRHNTVLIFDEIITGFRFPRYCVANYWGVQPDLILLGKAIGGGLPLSAIGGRREIMNCGEYFISGTFFGETVSMAACMEVINLVHRDGSKYSMKCLFEEGARFLDAFNSLEPSLKIVGYPSRGAFQGDEMTKALFWQECIKAGVLFGPSWFFNIPLSEYTDQLMPIFRDIFHKIRIGQVRLEGKMPKKPFAQNVRENGSGVKEITGTERVSERHEEVSPRC